MNEQPCRRRAIWAQQAHAAAELAPVESVAEVAKPNKHVCAKCGRVVMHGMYLHAKYCKGK